jgi:hypothetical protein
MIEEKVIAKIRKMLAHANDTAAGGEHERDTALRMAHNLLAKYNLSMSDVSQKNNQDDRSDQTEVYYDYVWMRMMAAAISKLYFCHLFTQKTGKKDRSKFTFVGREANVSTAKEMFEYVVKSVTKEASRVTTAAGENQTFKWSFCKGAALQIHHRCVKLREEAEAESRAEAKPGTQLVLASLYAAEHTANQNYINEKMGITLRKAPMRTRNTDSSGFAAGKAFGNKVGLNKQVH